MSQPRIWPSPGWLRRVLSNDIEEPPIIAAGGLVPFPEPPLLDALGPIQRDRLIAIDYSRGPHLHVSSAVLGQP